MGVAVGCPRGGCLGAFGVGRSPGPDCPPSGPAAGAGVGRPGLGALPPPTARPLGGLLGPLWGVRGRRSPIPDCPPSGRAAGAAVRRPGSGALPPPTARPLGWLPGPVWGVRGRTLSHPQLPALWAGCRGPCGASGVGRSPDPDCPPSGRADGAGVGRPGSDAPPPPTARPLGGLPGPVWGVRGRALSHPRLLALWFGCRGQCGASGVGRSPTPDCPPSGRAAGAGVGRPGSGALPPPTARPLGGLPGPVWGILGRTLSKSPTARPLGGLQGPVWGVRGRTLSHPRLPALWAGCRGRCGAYGVGRSPTPDCPPSGRAAGAGVGRPGSGALPPPTARPLGGLPGLVWGVRGRALSHPRLLALWAGCRGQYGASRVGRSPIPDCPPSGRAAGAGVGLPGSDALQAPTARFLGGLPVPVWGVRGRTFSHPRLPALWAGCRCRCGASGVGRAPSPDCSPSGRAAGAGVGRPGSGALPPPTARPPGGLPVPVWYVRGRARSHPRLLALWAGSRGRCGASGVGRSPSPDCSPSGRAAGAGVGPPGSDALPPPTARPLGGLPEPVWGVRGQALSHSRLPALWAGCRGRCGASGVGRSPTPDCPPSGRAAGAGVGRPGLDALPSPTARPLGGLPGPVWGVQGSDALSSPTACPLGGLPGPVWGVRGRALSHPRLPALWAGCRGRCGASGVGRSPTPDCLPSGRATGAGLGRPGSDAPPPPTARPPGGLPGPVWNVRGQTLSHPRLPALLAGCRSRCGASEVRRSPTPDCPPSGRAAGAGVGRPGSGALPPPTARPLGGLWGPVWGVRGRTLSLPRLPALWAGYTARPLGGGPVWGVRGRTLSHPRLPALWAGCRCRCGASGVGRSPTPDCPPSGRAAGAGVGRPGSGALPPPTARPPGGLPVPVWYVRGRARSHPRLLALWAGSRGRCGASGVGRSPTPDCSPSGRAAGAGVGPPGSDALPPPTARPLGGLPGPVWGVRGRAHSHPRLPALWAGCRGRCGASGVGRPPTPDCLPSGRATGAGLGRPGSDALPARARPPGGLPGPVWNVRGQTLSHPRLPALWAGCRGRCGASGVGRSPTPDCPPSGRAAGAGVGRQGSGALPPPTVRPLGGLPGPVWSVLGRTLSHPRLPALWAGCRGRCGASGVGRSPTPDCPPSGRAARAGVGCPGSDVLPPPTARPLGGLPVPVWGVRGRARCHPRLLALWAGCRGRCGASGVGRSPTPDCSHSGRASGAGVERPGSDALPSPTARPLGGLPGPVWGVRGRTLSHPGLPGLWAGCQGRCGVSGVGRSPTPDCPPSGRAAGAGVGRPGSGALPPPTARPLGGLPGPVWGVRGRALSHPRLLALWAGCRGRCGASGVGRCPDPDCPPSGRAAGAGPGRPGSDALPTPTARPLGGLPGPLWGVRGRTFSHPRLPALWAGCRCRCGASGVGRAPTPDCSPSGRAAGAGVGPPGSGALPPPTARPPGGLPVPVWGVRGRARFHPRLLALWAGSRGRCGASGVGRSPTPDCLPSGRAAGAGVGPPGSDALRPPTARPLGGLPGPVWGVRGWTLSHPRLPALWAGCRGRCGTSGVGRSPTPDCPPSGRAAGAGVGRPGSDALPPPTAGPLGGLPGPVWGVRGRTLSHPRLPALWEGCRGRCGASGVGRSPTPDCPPSGRAAGAGLGRPGSDALPPPTARPLGGLPGPVWGVRGLTLSHPRLPALWAGCRGRCGASGVGRSPTPDCPPSGRAAGAGVGRPGSDALPSPTAHPPGGLPGPVWNVRGRTLSHPRLPALWAGCRGRCGASAGRTLSHPRLPALQAGCRGRCGASGVGRSPTPDCPPSGRAAGAGVGRPGSGALPPPTARPPGGLPGPVWGIRGRTLSHPRLPALWAGCRGRCGAPGVGRSPTPDCPPSGRAAGAGVGPPGSDALPPPTARPLGGLPGPVWGVRGRTPSHPRLPALWAGCRGRCGAPGVGRSPTPDCSPCGPAAGAAVGRPGSDALPPPTTRPSGGLPGCCACACPAWPGWVGRPPGRVLVRLTFPLAFLACLFACLAPSGLGLPCLWLLSGFFFFFVFFLSSPPSVRPVVSCFACFPAWGALGLGVLLPPPPSPPPPFFFGPLPLPAALVSPAVVLLCAVLFCCARFVPALVVPCPLALPVALGPCALRCCVFRCSPSLCVFCRGVVVRAVVRRSALCCVCPGVLCCAFPVLSALCGAVLRCAGALALCCSCGGCCCWRLVLWCAAVCCGVSFGVLWCDAGSGGPWLSAGAVLWRPAVRFPLLVVLVCVFSLCVRCCVALRVVLFGAGVVCAVVGASCCAFWGLPGRSAVWWCCSGCRGVLLCCALSCGDLRPVPCLAVPCCPAVLCWLAVLCGCLRCWCLFFLLSSFPLLKTPAVFPCL